VRVADGALHVDAEPGAVPQARHWVAERLAGTPHEALTADAELVVSELVTNALLHGAPPVTVSVEVGDVVRIVVSDGSRSAPMRGRARADAMTGRGIALVASLARDWGVETRPVGKAVWCELAPAGAPAHEPVEEDIDALLAAWDDELDDGATRYTVSLGDVPTDLLLAAKAHVDNLVREFTLAAHGAESGRTSALPPHLAELFESVITGFSEARQSIKKQAIDAAAQGAERTTLTLTLPVEAADAGESYLVALDEIDTYARAARLLTLETPPQHRVFRRWYVEALVEQLRAVAAGLPQPKTETFERRLLTEVAAVEVARRAAERAARLQQVTAALAGTTSAQDVGQVVVSEGVAALGASGGGLLVAEAEDHLGVTAVVGYDAALVERLRSEHPSAELPAAVALRTGEPVWLESKEEREELFPELTALEPRTVSLCAVPLRAGDRVLAALRFSFETARLFDPDDSSRRGWRRRRR
jgi:anti-sigma regulatory factor (Ser/Thr protein kinase)